MQNSKILERKNKRLCAKNQLLKEENARLREENKRLQDIEQHRAETTAIIIDAAEKAKAEYQALMSEYRKIKEKYDAALREARKAKVAFARSYEPLLRKNTENLKQHRRESTK